MEQKKTIKQRTPKWYMVRLGKITGSQVGVIFKKGKATNKLFSDTALSYLKEIASERLFDDIIYNDEEAFKRYYESVNITTKAMQWGIDMEEEAKVMYEMKYNVEIKEMEFTQYNIYFGSSPDGFVEKENKAIEIKCLAADKMVDYMVSVTDGESFKKHNDKYYWQCVSHMLVTGASSCDFIIYNPYMKTKLWVLTLERDEKEIESLKERLEQAEEQIDSFVKTAKTIIRKA